MTRASSTCRSARHSRWAWCFAGAHGGYLNWSWFYKTIWQPACARAELAGFHFYWLRHGFASLMAAGGLVGEFPLYVTEQMGHTDAITSRSVYATLAHEYVRAKREVRLELEYA